MEGTMDMTSNTSNNTAAASAPQNNHQKQKAVVVSSPTKKEQARNSKKARAAQQAGGSGERKPRPPQEAALTCPRCFSTNTKFCYYNNYNLTQPRYFCKTCRRYWTQGGSLRNVPVGGGCRRKRASASSSSSAASSAEVTTRLRLMPKSVPKPSQSQTTGLFPNNDMLPAFTAPTGGSGGLDLAVDGGQQGFLPFAPLSSLPEDQALEELAPGGRDTTPTFLDMLRGGRFDAGGGSSSSYGGGLAMMSSGSNGMDMPFLLPEMGASATDPIQMPLVEGMNDVAAGDFQWATAELDNYINGDVGGYAAGPGAGVEQQQQQQVVGDQQQVEDNNKDKATESSKNNNDGGGGSSLYSYWINTNNSDGAQG